MTEGEKVCDCSDMLLYCESETDGKTWNILEVFEVMVFSFSMDAELFEVPDLHFDVALFISRYVLQEFDDNLALISFQNMNIWEL